MRVVLINDRRAERDSMVRVLQQASCTVEPFDDAKGALVAIERESPHVMVVTMPGSGFLELIRRIRSADAPGTAYLLAVLDATAGGREIPAILDAGAQDFLRRPWLDL